MPTSWSSPATWIAWRSSDRQPESIREEVRVARDVLGVALRVSVLGIDRDDQPLEDVEALGEGGRSTGRLGDPDSIPAAALRLAEGDRRDREETRDRIGIQREDADARADGQRQLVGFVVLQAHPLQLGSELVERRSRCAHDPGLRDHEELVRSVAADDRALRRTGSKDAAQLEERGVARGIPVGIVEESEVVDVNEAHLDRASRGASGLDAVGECDDDRAMVKRPGERVATRRLDKGDGLAPQTAMGGSEDQVQDERHDQRGRKGEEHDLLPRRPDSTEHGLRVARDRKDGADDAAGSDRKRFREDLGRAEPRVGGRPDARGGRSGCGLGEIGRRRRGLGEAVACEQERTGRCAHLDPKDVASTRDNRQLGLKSGDTGGGKGRRIEIRRRECAVDEDPNQGGVGCDDRVERLAGHVRRNED